MKHYTKPKMQITYFGKTNIVTTSAVVPNYAANNMNLYMTGTLVKAIQTRTAAVKDVMNFTN